MSEIPFKDRTVGRAAEAAAWLSVHYKPFGDFMVGDDERLTPLAWRRVRIRTPEGSEGPIVAHYPGVAGETKKSRPSKYGHMARTFVRQTGMLHAELERMEDRELAIAWCVGKQAMAAVVPREAAIRILWQGAYDLRLAGNPLDTTLGVQQPGERDLLVYPGTVETGPVVPLSDYPEDGQFF